MITAKVVCSFVLSSLGLCEFKGPAGFSVSAIAKAFVLPMLFRAKPTQFGLALFAAECSDVTGLERCHAIAASHRKTNGATAGGLRWWFFLAARSWAK